MIRPNIKITHGDGCSTVSVETPFDSDFREGLENELPAFSLTSRLVIERWFLHRPGVGG